MGEVIERITLVNIYDEGNLRHGYIKETEVRKVNLRTLLDTSATNLVINEKTRLKLGLGIRKTGEVTLGHGKRKPCSYTEWVTVCWKDRQAVCEAIVLPHAKETLYFMEDYSLRIDSHDLLVYIHGTGVWHLADVAQVSGAIAKTTGTGTSPPISPPMANLPRKQQISALNSATKGA